MPDTTMEAALEALAAALDAATSASVIRNSDRPEAVPADGLVVLRDGAQDIEDESMSPLRYHIEHVAEVVIHADDEGTRDFVLADLSAALVADRTLSGAVDFLEVRAVSFEPADFDGAEAARGALMPVALHYTTLASPAG
jgi:hypothetical protein